MDVSYQTRRDSKTSGNTVHWPTQRRGRKRSGKVVQEDRNHDQGHDDGVKAASCKRVADVIAVTPSKNLPLVVVFSRSGTHAINASLEMIL